MNASVLYAEKYGAKKQIAERSARESDGNLTMRNICKEKM